jgi:hypothetical protein
MKLPRVRKPPQSIQPDLPVKVRVLPPEVELSEAQVKAAWADLVEYIRWGLREQERLRKHETEKKQSDAA